MPRELIEVGAIIGGRYRVSRWLGRGGMGSVYEVEDGVLSTSVALKMAEADVWNASTVAQLKREIMLARRVTHPNVCRVHDFGIHVLPSGAGAPFLTMELVRGDTLTTVLEQDGPLPAPRVLGMLDQIAAALDAAHEAGVVHRDFKTGNVMLAAGRIIVTDFGLAVDVVQQPGEPHSSFVGSPAYMSPEQVRGAPITRGTDVYALGVVLYELLSGRLPFSGSTSLEVATRRLHEPPTPLSTYLASVDPRWEHVIERCLRLEPADRWGSCGDVARAARAEGAVSIDLIDEVQRAERASTGPRAVVVVLAEGVHDLRVIERACVRRAGVLVAPAPGRIEAVFGAQRSLGDEIDRALAVARAAAKVSEHVSIAVGRGVLREGRLEGEAREEAEAALRAATAVPGTRGLAASDRTALALATRAELVPLAPGFHRVGSSRRDSAPLVGRDAELSLLRRSRDAVLDEQRLLATWIFGPPGIGKSRLLEAAAAMAAERGMTVHIATGSSEGGRAMGLFPDDGAASVDEPRHGAQSMGERSTIGERSDPEAQADRVRERALEVLERLSSEGPLALMLDHLQWGDAASLALLEELPLAFPDRAIWVVLAAREELIAQRPGLVGALEVAARLEPSPLRAADVTTLAARVLGAPPSPAFVHALVERTGGNPLFVEQLLASLPRGAAISEALAEWPLPATVELAVQARLDRLPAGERECVGLLAVYGRAAFARELEAMGLEGAAAHLAALARRSLVLRAAGEAGGYRLRNQVVNDVAYHLLDEGRRILLHARAADVARANGREPEDVARHLAEAGERAAAAMLYAQATLEAAARGDGRVVLRCAARAIALGLPAEHAFSVHFARADAARFVGDALGREQLLDDASRAASNDHERALVLVERAEWLRRNRRPDEALGCLREAIELARAADDVETLALATARQGGTLIALGRAEDAARALDSLAPVIDACSARTRAIALDVRGYLAGNVGDLGAQRRAYEAAAALYAEAGDARRAAGAESNLADAQNRLGRYAQADASLRRALELARKVGNRLTEGYALMNLGFALTGAGRDEEALEVLDRARAIARAMGDAHLTLGARLYAARARLPHADLALVEELTAIATDAGSDVTLQANALAMTARAALAIGNVALACASADRALVVRQSRGSVEEGEGDIFLAASLSYEAAGRTEDADRARRDGRARIEALATRIGDSDARASFLENVASHRALARS